MQEPPYFKKILSYLYPIVIERRGGILDHELEVRLERGRIVLNTKNANYSFGSLHKVWRKALSNVEVLKEHKILVLGAGVGSIRKILHEEMGVKAHLTMVEFDPVVLEIGSEYFGFGETPLLCIELADAFEYCRSTQEKFDLILIDLFVDKEMPGYLIENSFWEDMKSCCAPNATILLNTIVHDEKSRSRVNTIQKTLSNLQGDLSKITLQDINHLFILKTRS